MRLVGFFRSRELSGLSRSIRITRDRPNASMRSARVSGSGNCRRVAEATPSVLWQLRQLAFSRTGYRPATKEVSCAQAGWRRARADSAIDEILTFDGLPQLSLLLQGVWATGFVTATDYNSSVSSRVSGGAVLQAGRRPGGVSGTSQISGAIARPSDVRRIGWP